MVKFIKDRWDDANRVFPIKYLHLMAIGFTFGINTQNIYDIMGMITVYLIYMANSTILLEVSSIVVYVSVVIWRKIRLWLNINS